MLPRSRPRIWGLVFFAMAIAFPLRSYPASGETPAELRFRLTADPATLDWNLAHTSHETYVIMNVMEGLVEEGSELEPRPGLAERWEVSPDGKTYTFYLRKGVKWSDGRPLKASEFVDSWLRLLNPKTKSSYASFLLDVDNAPEFQSGKLKDPAKVGVRALDDFRFQVRLSRRVPYFLHLPTFWVTFPIRLDLIQKYGPSWTDPDKIATLGPYRLSEWKKGKKIRLEQNREYFAKDTFKGPRTVEAIIEPDDQKARRLFAAGELDFLLDPTTDDLLLVKGKSGARIEQFPYLATYYLGFNLRNSLLGHQEIRRALTAGVDRDGIPSLLQGGQTVARSWLPPGIPGHKADRPLPMTLLNAKGMLAKAGFVEGRGFPKLAVWVEKFDGADSLARYLKRSFYENLGISIETHIGTAAEHQAALLRGKFGMFVGHWGADFPDAANFLEIFSSSSGTNYTGWKDPEFDRNLAAGRSSSDPVQRLAAYEKAEARLLEDQAVIVPLFYKKNSVVLGSKIKAFRLSPLNYLFLKNLIVSGN